MPEFDHTKIDDVIHGRLRLGIMAYLSTTETTTFVELRATVNATDGNLSKQLSRLEEAGYVRIAKVFNGRKPQTFVHLTPAGREAWIAYLSLLEAFIRKPGETSS
jgi:DNA-binding MarR family transcriptional regulator